MLLLSIILAMIFLTPIGWIGMLCLGAVICLIIESRESLDFEHGAINERIIIARAISGNGEVKSIDELKEFLRERE